MKIQWTNQTTYWRNPTVSDFISNRVDVDLRPKDSYTTWQDWDEKNGTVKDFKAGNEICHIDLSSDNPPSQLKITSNSGVVHYFYKSKFIKWYNEEDSQKSWYTYEYVLDKWYSKHLKHFNKMLQSKTQIEFVQKQADEIIFHYNLKLVDETKPLIIKNETIGDVKEAVSYVFNYDPQYIEDYFNVEINTQDKTIEIIPLIKDDKLTYYFTNGNPLEAGSLKEPWKYELGDPTTNTIQTNPIFYCINIHIQKHLGDIKRKLDDPIRLAIGGKTRNQLYQQNGIDPESSITFYHFSNHSNFKSFKCSELDSMFKNHLGNYEHIACKSSTLKKWSPDHNTITSLGDQTILKIPLNNDMLKLMNSILDILYPPYDEGGSALGPKPQPWKVQIDPLSTGNKYSDALLDDTPIGLLFSLGRLTINQHRREKGMVELSDEDIFQFGNIGTEDDIWHDFDDINKIGSVLFLRTDINHDILLKISSLDENNSLENDAKKIIKNKINGIDDFNTNAILLNPSYQWEGIFYDNDSYLLIDFSKINYNIQGNELELGGLEINCHLCWIHSLVYFYEFGNFNNDLDKEWNNNKTNLRFENKKTVGIMGDNANNMMNGSALASYTNFKTNVNTWQNREQKFAISETMKSIGLVGDIVGMFNPLNWFTKSGSAKSAGARAGSAMGGVEDIAGDIAGIATSALDYQYQNNQQKLKYNNQIQNVRSQSNVEVSMPYISAFGSQADNELFKRYKFTLKPWDRIKLLTEVRANGYVYDSINFFKNYDNRRTHNYVRISSNWNMNVIRNELVSNDFFDEEHNINEFLDWLVSGIRVWKKEITDITTTQNLENILPPPSTNKRNINVILNFNNLGGHFNDERLKDENEWIKDIETFKLIWPVNFWENIDFDFSNILNGILILRAKESSEKYYGEKIFNFMIIDPNQFDHLVYQVLDIDKQNFGSSEFPEKYRNRNYYAVCKIWVDALNVHGINDHLEFTIIISPDEGGNMYCTTVMAGGKWGSNPHHLLHGYLTHHNKDDTGYWNNHLMFDKDLFFLTDSTDADEFGNYQVNVHIDNIRIYKYAISPNDN